jgi:hypothetical protein
MTLQANAAQAALKISCFVQAVEHCDKVGGRSKVGKAGYPASASKCRTSTALV